MQRQKKQHTAALSFFQRLIISPIRLYQKTLSPNHSRFFDQSWYGCRYYPSCSEYMIRAVQKHGVFYGVSKGLFRILRCNPFSHGGVDDPLQEKKKKERP